MNTEEDIQLRKRNIEILQELNDEILQRYKDIKKELSQQKDGQVNETILSQMETINAKTKELKDEVDMRLMGVSMPKKLIESFEKTGAPLEYYKHRLQVLEGLPELNRIRKIRANADAALTVLLAPDDVNQS